ncbi:MAG: ribosome biogenesis/translation initiation ATPase RLI [Candidatus Altiarchaeota archaeon]|nr:ribosome biogenesis/translation initiation ATPase RLI [Candidatus Altiarchaeota archaeon]
MRIVTVDPNKCRPNKCGHECFKFCPIVKSGEPKIIQIGEKSVIDEDLCIGCGICVKVCPFKAISVINLPEAAGEPVHRYGQNLFALFGLPIPGESVGILGPNGTGKTTLLNIFAGKIIPNMGNPENDGWIPILEKFSGTEVGKYLKHVSKGELTIAYKPQHITALPKSVKGTVGELLEKVDEQGRLPEILDALGMQHMLNKDVSTLSGGELQKTAIAATLAKDADVYFLDEPGSFLDIFERLRVARAVQNFTKKVFVVEHDLVMLDFLVDELHVTYGKPAVYGVISMRKGVRVGINEFLEGYLSAENVRIRDSKLKFMKSLSHKTGIGTLVSYTDLAVKLGSFDLKVSKGEIKNQEIIGILGRNGTGKTTFIRMLAGLTKPEVGKIDKELEISYKPQYIESPKGEVSRLFKEIRVAKDINLNRDIFSPLQLVHLLDRDFSELSGGELQRVSIGLTLAREADLYLLDEPSAFLDSEQRLNVAKLIKRLIQNSGKSAMVVDHDLMFLDYLSDRVMVFKGEPGVSGEVSSPTKVRLGMNEFLQSVNITLRRDPQTKRPRINKVNSQKDKEQKESGHWYEPL